MPLWDYSESLVNLFQILMARAMHPIPGPKKAELSDLLESEKDHAGDYGNKFVAVLKLQRELDELLNDVQIKRRHLEELQGSRESASTRVGVSMKSSILSWSALGFCVLRLRGVSAESGEVLAATQPLIDLRR